MNENTLSDELSEKHKEPNYKDLVHNSCIAIYTTNSEGYITFYNDAAAVLWGQKPVVGNDLWHQFWNFYAKDGVAMPLAASPLARTLKEGIPFHGREIIIEKPDHSLRNLLVYTQPLFDHHRILVGSQNTLVDITGQKSGVNKQALLSAIVTSSDDAIISKNLDGIIMSWNLGAQKIFGYKEREIVGKDIHILIPSSLQNEEDIIIQSIKKGQKINHFQTIRVNKSGKLVPVSLTVSPIKDSHGNIIGASKIARDISDQLKAQQLIAEKTKALETLNLLRKQISERVDEERIMRVGLDAAVEITGAEFGVFYFQSTLDVNKLKIIYSSASKFTLANKELHFHQDVGSIYTYFKEQELFRAGQMNGTNRTSPLFLYQHGHALQEIGSCISIPILSQDRQVQGGLFLAHTQHSFFKSEHKDLIVNISSQTENALDSLKLFEDLKQLSARKDEFIALAGHELKTPLTAILAYVQLLERINLDKQGKQFLDKIILQLNKVNIMIGDLLDISKIESGKFCLNRSHFDVIHLIETVIEPLEYSHKSHKIVLKKGEQQIWLYADEQRIEQTLINLINNAIKYSPGKNEVVITVERQAAEVKVSIRDKGKGLSSTEIKKIFTRFYRVDDNSTITGLGLGLYLSKEFIESHKGRLEVQSQLDIGSDFSFFLPIP